jgi:hypothetical protein
MRQGTSDEESDSNTPIIDKFDNPADWLRSFKGCEHYSDDEALQIISSLDTLAAILLETSPVKMYTIDNQLFVSLKEEQNRKNNAA